jgi:hypothetical protein
MMRTSVFFALVVFFSLPLTGMGGRPLQDRSFTDPGGKYELVLREGWEPTTQKDGGGNMVTDFIFENRERGLLRIREVPIEGNPSAEDAARREVENRIRFMPGYTAGSTERFTTTHAEGVALSFDFSRGGRNKTARYYYLKFNDTTVYVLKFEGDPAVLRSMRNRTDLMARSFRLLR